MTTLRHWTHDGPTIVDSRANYLGADLSGMLIVPVSQSRDSGPLDRSNFRAALARLGGESETVQVHSFGHWACGWYELLLITADSPYLTEAETIADELESYPVLDEDDYSTLEWSEMTDYWRGLSLRNRIELCARFGLSIFAARRDRIPDNDGNLDDYLRAE